MKKLIVVAAALLILGGCFGGGDDVTQPQEELPSAVFDRFEAPEFIVDYPKGWKVKNDFTSTLEKVTRVAFISNIKEVFFTPVVTVSSRDVSEGVLPADFGQQIIDQNEKTLLNYQLIDRNEVVLGPDRTTVFVQFRGKTEPADDIVEYFQVYYVRGAEGYVVTGAHDPNGDLILAERLLETVRSFRLR